MADIWGKLKEPRSIQLTSSVPGRVITKPRIRQQVWDFLEEHDLVNFPRPVHKRIPNFKGAATAGQLVASLPEFKKACVVKVNPDKPQEEVRYHVLDHKKTLLVPTPRLKSGLFNLMENPGNCSKENLRMLASRQGIDNNSKPVPLTYRAGIDVVVIGSVAVDKLGHRIGKGEGYADLEFAMGVITGSILEDAVVIATVHDCQLFNSLPEEIFGEHDITVDIIVTPTTIHRVEKRLPKPSKVMWEMLSIDKFKKVPILKQLKEEQEKLSEAGQAVHEYKSRQKGTVDRKDDRRGEREQKINNDTKDNKEGQNRKMVDQKNRDKDNNISTDKGEKTRKNTTGNKGGQQGRVNKNANDINDMKPKQRDRDSRHPIDDKEDERMVKNGMIKENISKNTKDRNMTYDDRPMLYVGKIPKNVRVRDLKEVMLERDVKPKELVWKGFKGFAFLYFDVSDNIEKIFESLQDLKIGDNALDIQREKYAE